MAIEIVEREVMWEWTGEYFPDGETPSFRLIECCPGGECGYILEELEDGKWIPYDDSSYYPLKGALIQFALLAEKYKEEHNDDQ